MKRGKIDMEYMVSICIPTYNRKESLRKCLDSLVKQPEFIEGKVEVVISDNASSDGTDLLGKKYAKDYPGVKYYRNEKNVGAEKNFPLSIIRAKGVLRKLHNDTTVFHEGSLALFCDAVDTYKSEKPVLFWGNGNLSNLVREEVTDKEKFLMLVGEVIIWMGSFSIWGEDIENAGTQDIRYNSAIGHVWETAYLLHKKSKIVIFNERILDIHEVPKGKDVSYGLFKVFYKEYLSVIQSLIDDKIVTIRCYDYLEKHLLFHFLLQMTAQWEAGSPQFIYSSDENLKFLVFKACKTKPYFDEFQKMYKKALLVYKIKFAIKRFLGENSILLKIARRLLRK